MSRVVKDAFWQILGRIASAAGGFLVIKLMTPYLGPIRYGDYSTILKYFAIRSALADFGVYVIALRELGAMKKQQQTDVVIDASEQTALNLYYSKFVTSRCFMIFVIYTLALCGAYMIPSYTSNPYLVRGLPFGMLFSASFMMAGILQLPLQLFRKMEQVSIGLIVARLVQLGMLAVGVYLVFPYPEFTNTGPITPFLMILLSIVASGVSQGIYVYRAGRRHLQFSRVRDWNFTKKILTDNRQYGIAYYLSSFHTLIVLILLSIFFPTIQGYGYVGIWALALSLLEIMLIVPSSLGNSLIHKVAHFDTKQKLCSFGALLSIVVRISSIATLNFVLFSTQIIQFVGGSTFLSREGIIGSDIILPYLGIVLILSFIKQVCNYIFVAEHIQNKLFWSNLGGVIIGLIVGVPMIYIYHIRGAIITQVMLEIGFVCGAGWIARKRNLLPVIDWKFLGYICLTVLTVFVITRYIPYIYTGYWWIFSAACINSLILLCWRTTLKKVGKML